MSHEIRERDSQTGIEMAWHGLTNVVNVVTRENAMPWEVEKRQMFLPGQKATEFKILVATDDELPIGVPFADSYVPNTVRGFWETVESVIGNGARIVSAGSIMNRSKIFISIEMKGNAFKAGGREFNGYLNILDSFDKTMSMEAHYTNICVVCANTFAWSMAEAKNGEFRARAKHSKNFLSAAGKVREAMEEFAGVHTKFADAMKAFHGVTMSEDQAQWFFAGLVGNGEVLSTRAKNTIERLLGLFRTGRGNDGKTMLDVFSAVTDYFTHDSAGNATGKTQDEVVWKQYLSSEFGDGRNKKELAFDILRDEKRLKDTIKIGKARIRATEKRDKES